MSQISPFNYFISGDAVIESGADPADTGIKAELQTLNHAGIPTSAFCLKGIDQFKKAIKEMKAAYPQAEVSVVSAEAEHASGLPTIGGLATSNAWLKVNGAVLVHPLMVRLRARTKKLRELDQEFKQAGILADLV